MDARNTLTQRPFAKRDESVPTVATAKMESKGMKDGDVAGLAVLQDPYAYIGVRRMGNSKYLVMVNNGKLLDSVPVSQSTIYFRAQLSNKSKKAAFEYSFDNKTFRSLGNELMMRFSLKIFTGNKFGLFNYATRAAGGYVDVDWFRVE